MLTRLQGFEPTGVFARDVRECLMLQLKERDRCDPAMEAMLDNLEMLARRDMAGLKRVCGVDDEDLARNDRRTARSNPPAPAQPSALNPPRLWCPTSMCAKTSWSAGEWS